ncbi:hypothetical protein GW891_00855 [bacterium]|nr:hypothetical protein [bacterium]
MHVIVSVSFGTIVYHAQYCLHSTVLVIVFVHTLNHHNFIDSFFVTVSNSHSFVTFHHINQSSLYGTH